MDDSVKRAIEALETAHKQLNVLLDAAKHGKAFHIGLATDAIDDVAEAIACLTAHKNSAGAYGSSTEGGRMVPEPSGSPEHQPGTATPKQTGGESLHGDFTVPPCIMSAFINFWDGNKDCISKDDNERVRKFIDNIGSQAK